MVIDCKNVVITNWNDLISNVLYELLLLCLEFKRFMWRSWINAAICIAFSAVLSCLVSVLLVRGLCAFIIFGRVKLRCLFAYDLHVRLFDYILLWVIGFTFLVFLFNLEDHWQGLIIWHFSFERLMIWYGFIFWRVNQC